MGDPKWKECLIPIMPVAVSALTEIITEDLMDLLLASKCLTRAKFLEMIESLRRSEIDKSRSARDLFIKLMRCGPPSFDVFCSALKTFEGGDQLWRLLTSSRGHVTQPTSAEGATVAEFLDQRNSNLVKLV